MVTAGENSFSSFNVTIKYTHKMFPVNPLCNLKQPESNKTKATKKKVKKIKRKKRNKQKETPQKQNESKTESVALKAKYNS